MVIDQISNLILTGVSYQGIFMIRDVILVRAEDLKVSVLEKVIENNELRVYKEDKLIIRLDTSGPNLDLFCVPLLIAAPFCENYAKLYFDAEHLEKGLSIGR